MNLFKDIGKFLRVFFNLRSRMPRHVQIEVTNRCNFACEMCPRKALQVKDADMPWDIFETIIRRIPAPEIFTLTGWGEPLCHPAFAEMLALINEVHPRSNIKFTTNGLLLKDELLAAVLEHDVSQINVSIEQSPNSERKSQGHPPAVKLDQNLKAFFKRGKTDRPRLLFQTVMHKSGLEEILKLVDYAVALGVDGLNLVRVDVSYQNSLERDNPKAERDYIRAVRKYAHSKGLRVNCINDQNLLIRLATHFDRRCLRLDDYLYINVDGQITPCCSLPHLEFGDAAKDDFPAVWHSEKFCKFQRNYLKTCSRCDALTHLQR